MRLGLFGGTFDPPHVGHLLAASDAFEALELDRLAFIPNAVQPLKSGQTGGAIAPAPDRLEMVRRLCQGDARFGCDSIEVDRGGLSFTIETLRAYRTQFPDAALFLLIGEDVVESLRYWRDSDELFKLATLIVLTRGDGDPDAAWQWRRVNARRVDVSSTEIRARVKAGLSLTGFVPEPVAAYITERGLYR